MQTAVFNKEHVIQGFLEHDESDRHKRTFCRSAFRRFRAGEEKLPLASVVATHQYIAFEWAVIASSRSQTETFYCGVLIADNCEALIYLQGFRFFAEVYGKIREVTTA